jgi:hypothetical protein
VTPQRSIRVEQDLWQGVLIKAKENDTTATAIIIQALSDYLKD